MQMMELRANDANTFAGFDGRPTSRGLMNERPRGGKMYDTGIQRVSLNVGGKRNSGGIRDDESILCPTPPNREVSGYELAHDPGVKYLQPINFTVNVNNTGTMGMGQPYFG